MVTLCYQFLNIVYKFQVFYNENFLIYINLLYTHTHTHIYIKNLY